MSRDRQQPVRPDSQQKSPAAVNDSHHAGPDVDRSDELTAHADPSSPHIRGTRTRVTSDRATGPLNCSFTCRAEVGVGLHLLPPTNPKAVVASRVTFAHVVS
ncbi:hypothetical protein RHA1_ro00964 [Rhodococcus jostii RHA1]|uniref:Uncharacterized protein n=1 Tax=Rhodococcus jostii (strain RHA1) TaxID=101510 RepID=Q0SI44_RHOJR|nr:hypothetical protein RHA1_ro00964 [Rhodococcus jostii RHA1]